MTVTKPAGNMTPDESRTFMNHVLELATDAGHQLKLVTHGNGYRWEWSNGWKGATTAATKPVALYMACCDYMDMSSGGRVMHVHFQQT